MILNFIYNSLESDIDPFDILPPDNDIENLNINYYDYDKDVEIIKDKPFEFNRKVRKERMEENTKKDFTLVKNEHSEIIIIENHNKR